jgi:eukaryotic-like serine/threonine-protein kinase
VAGIHDGRRFGPYLAVATLGAGGQGTVLLAVVADGQGPPVVVKIPHAGVLGDAAGRAAVLDEIHALAHGRGVLVPQLKQAALDDTPGWFAVEYIEGVPLAAVADSLTPKQVAWVGWHLASALGALRLDDDTRLFHRDLSARNVLVTRAGDLRLTDFGLAHFAGRQHQTATGESRGSLDVMAPERVRGERIETDTALEKAEVFAVGALLYRLLYREGLYAREDDPFAAALRGPDRETLAKAPLGAVLSAALAVSPDERPSLDGLAALCHATPNEPLIALRVRIAELMLPTDEILAGYAPERVVARRRWAWALSLFTASQLAWVVYVWWRLRG